jgi:hypothetical protein
LRVRDHSPDPPSLGPLDPGGRAECGPALERRLDSGISRPGDTGQERILGSRGHIAQTDNSSSSSAPANGGDANGAPPILILSVPRSGSTWIGQILGEAAAARYIHEPDNETEHPYALRAKRDLGRFPFLRPGERARRYEACWEAAFGGAEWPRRTWLSRRALDRQPYAAIEAWCDPDRWRPVRLAMIAAFAGPGRVRIQGQRPVVKSVHGLLAGEWLIRRWRPLPVVVRRHPLNVVASWRKASTGAERESALEYTGSVRALLPPRAIDELGAGVAPPPAEDRLAALAWFVGLLAAAREELVARNEGVVCVDHDDLCAAPRAGLRALATRLGLEWTEGCDRALQRAERPGDGFVTERIAAEQPNRWRTRLSPSEVARVEEVLSAFPRGPWFGSPAP